MKRIAEWHYKLAFVVVVMVVFVSLLQRARAQGHGMGLVDDWSHHHLIFSNPGTFAEAIANGRYSQWYQTVTDPRYIMQQMKRNHPAVAPHPQSDSLTNSAGDPGGLEGILKDRGNPDPVEPGGPLGPKQSPETPHRDWAFSLGNGTVAENMYPAKFGFNINATPVCASDYVAYGLNVAGTTGGQANMVALNNLYSGTGTPFCAGHAAPTVYWAYNGSFAGGTVTTSPALSMDGSKVIYIESGGSTGPYLHVLEWNSADGGTVAASKAPTHVLAAGQGVSSCTAGASCLVSILLNTTTETVTNSSPYYDYTNDIAYVGDDDGILYKVTPVLGSGTPVVTKLTVATGTELTGPVYDGSSGFVFVGSTNGALYAVTATTFSSVAGTLQIGDTTCSGGLNNKLTDAPTVDSTNGWVYEYITANATPVTGIEQASTAGPFTTKNFVETGEGDSACNSGTSFPTHAPAFDNNYFNGTVTSGHIWVCGREAAGVSDAELWEIPTTGANGSISGVTAVANSVQLDEVAHAQCSPMTEIFNSSTDYLFFGEGLAGSFGRLYGYTIGGGATAAAIAGSPITYPTATGGTSAIVIDNVSADAQASSIYFTTQATSATTCGATAAYCAIKLTQSALN